MAPRATPLLLLFTFGGGDNLLYKLDLVLGVKECVGMSDGD